MKTFEEIEQNQKYSKKYTSTNIGNNNCRKSKISFATFYYLYLYKHSKVI